MRWRAALDPAIVPAYVTTGLRMILRSVRGARRYGRDARAICRAIVDDCWTGDYLAASAGHFRQFWTRDLGFSAGPLVRLGQGARVEASLAWALDAWSGRGRVTTTIFPTRRPADVFTLGVDSLPLLLHALRTCRAEGLVDRHAGWLRPELDRYAREVVDQRTALVRSDRIFSTHRDTVRTRSNGYANTMLALLAQTLEETGWLPSPIPPGATQRFLDAFWRGDHFAEERGPKAKEAGEGVTGDANVFPFWLGVVPADGALLPALRSLEGAGLANPLPLRYAARRDSSREDPVGRLFAPNYQGTAIWTSLGSIYLSLLWTVDVAAAEPEIAGYMRLIERDGTMWEVLDEDLQPYRGRLGLFRSDEAMLWSAIFLDLLERRVVAAEPADAAASAPALSARA